MNIISEQILHRIDSTRHEPDFLEVLFGKFKIDAINGMPVVLYGAGGLGSELLSTLKSFGVSPVCFCDSDDSKNGILYCEIPVISFRELQELHRESLIVIASHKYIKQISEKLLQSGFKSDHILCKPTDKEAPIIYMYSMIGTQLLIYSYKQQCGSQSVFDTLLKHEQHLLDAYNLFADQHSKDLFVTKLSLMASDRNYVLFREFIQSFSQPVLEFGYGNYNGTPEDYYYFNNDVITFLPDEVYVDVGAYDGDTVQTFIQACNKHQVNYKWIYTFEPDPNCFKSLLKNTSEYKNISHYQKGIWSISQKLRFKSSENVMHDQAAILDPFGNIEVEVVSLDEFLKGEKVTFIKMDPGGNIIPEAIIGAAKTISKHKPKLALGAYHALESSFEIPILVHKICPDYKLYLRHNTYHLCDTDLFATL